MFTIIDRYIVKELLGPFFFGIIAFSSILGGSLLLIPLMSEAAKYSIPTWHVFQLFFYQLPGVIVYTFPMSMLLATILAFGRLNGDHEITAFRAVGISFFRIVVPVIVTGLMVSLITIWFSESIVPKATHSSEKLFRSHKKKDDPTIKENVNITEYDELGRPSRIINVLEINQGLLNQVTVLEYDNGELVRAVKSNSGKWLNTGGWEFYDGVMHSFSMIDKSKVLVIEFEKEFIDIKRNPFDFTKREKSVEEMNAKELRKRIDLKKTTGEDFDEDLLKFHMKFSVPFACLIFAILGASVGLRPHRSSSAMGLGVSLLIILAYYVLVGVSVGISGLIPAFIAAWLPNTIIGATGLYFLKKLSLH